MRRGSRPGFTLMEVLVALAVSAVVILGARALLDGLVLHAGRVAALARRADAEANADHLLRSTVALAGLTTDSARFDGTPEGASFRSWCDEAGGWQEQCDVRLTAEHEGSEVRVVLALGGSARVEVAARGSAASFRYLASASDGGHWVERWERAITPPLAIGLVTRATLAAAADTAIIRVGAHD